MLISLRTLPGQSIKSSEALFAELIHAWKFLQGGDIWNLKKNSFIFQMKLNIRSDQFVYKEKGWMGTGVLSAKDPNVSASSIIWSLGHVLVLSQLFFGAGTFLFLLYLVREWKTWVIIPSLPARCVRSNGVIKWGWVITTPKHICTKTWECPDTSKAIWSSYSLSIENKEICSNYKKCKLPRIFLGHNNKPCPSFFFS